MPKYHVNIECEETVTPAMQALADRICKYGKEHGKSEDEINFAIKACFVESRLGARQKKKYVSDKLAFFSMVKIIGILDIKTLRV